MRPRGFLGAGQWLSRAMSRCVLEPRPPGKRWMVAGLGNPGLPGTRHSVGMAVLGQLARRLGVAESWTRDRHCAADLALAPLGDAQLVLLRPRRLMNANGRSVARAGLAWTHHHHHHHQWLSPHCFLGAGLSFPPPRAVQEGTESPVRIMWKEAKGGFNPGVLMLKSVRLTTLAFCFLRNKCLVSFRGGCTGPWQSLLSPRAWTRASRKAQCLAAAHRRGFRMAQLVLWVVLELPAPPTIFNTIGDFLACGFHLCW
ncbi:peptidyl-tRNA hydrolase isoform X1 [Macaca fascicularis]|uniref:peptidyl-tRNA hydrolase isoform X1 n=1 Tax=Macaca fascicularis TaxID=9541 RepID=UPI0032B03E48